MDGSLQHFVALDGFQVVEIDIDERCRRQHNRQTQREHEPESVVAAPELFSLRLHSNLPKTLRHTKAYPRGCQAVLRGRKKMLRNCEFTSTTSAECVALDDLVALSAHYAAAALLESWGSNRKRLKGHDTNEQQTHQFW